MGADVATGLVAPPDRVPAAPPLGRLTRRASLNAAAFLLDYVVKIGVRLVITPILVHGLGRALFGVWEMLQRMATYMSATDGRPTEALRLVIAQRQGDADHAEKRRLVGAALAVWALLLPLIAAVGVLFVWIAPMLTHAAPAARDDVRLTSGLLVLTFLLTTLWSIPESVLRGMNLSYRRMGLQAAMHVLGGAAAVGAIWGGLGLVGVGGAEAVRALATGLCFWVLVRSYVHWFGVARPARAEVGALFGMSLWLAGGDVIAKILLASDVLILGAILGPAVVTTYVLTGYAARTAVGVHVFTAQAAMPGLGGLLGGGEHARAARTRRELLVLTWWFVTVVGAGVLLWNPSFVRLWVGGENYAGLWVDLLIVGIAMQTAFIRVDAYVIDAGLRPRQRVLAAATAAVLTIALAIGLTRAFGLVGLCAGILGGRAIQTIGYPVLARSVLGRPAGSRLAVASLARLVAVTAVGLTGAALLGQRLEVSSWPVFAGGVVATTPAVAALAFVAGPDAAMRRAIVARVRAIRDAGRSS